MACDKLVAAGYTNIVNVEGGTSACEQAGLPVARGKKVMSLERQVRIAAGSLVFTGTLLAIYSPWFLIIPGFVGAGARLRRHHRYLRHGHDARPDAVESGVVEAASCATGS